MDVYECWWVQRNFYLNEWLLRRSEISWRLSWRRIIQSVDATDRENGLLQSFTSRILSRWNHSCAYPLTYTHILYYASRMCFSDKPSQFRRVLNSRRLAPRILINAKNTNNIIMVMHARVSVFKVCLMCSLHLLYCRLKHCCINILASYIGKPTSNQLCHWSVHKNKH